MQDVLKDIIAQNGTKIVFLILDGLGGLPVQGRTELEVADTPNMDALARASACGMHVPVALGITPGSGPGHLALFGYDPKEFEIGRGVLETLGLDVELKSTDVALRCNYATIKDGIIKDRRAGRLPTEESAKLTDSLQKELKNIDEAELIFRQGMEHRFAIVMRFPEPLVQGAAAVSDSDPQKEGKEPLVPTPSTPEAERVARVAEKLIAGAAKVLKGQKKANAILLRGFSTSPVVPSFRDVYGLRALAIASYPMYRGIAKLLGMDAPPVKGGIKEVFAMLEKRYDDYDFFFVHIKEVDTCGEDGDFGAKAKKIEEVDRHLPKLLAIDPGVLVITGDHSTPSVLKGHSWHPVPVLIKSPYVLGRMTERFSERDCLRGELATFPTTSLMPLALANAGRLKKYGA